MIDRVMVEAIMMFCHKFGSAKEKATNMFGITPTNISSKVLILPNVKVRDEC
jgi:hypothetical protein